MNALVNLKNICDDFAVEFEVSPPVDFTKEMDERQKRIFEGIASIDEQLAESQKIINDFNSEIDKLINNADGIDYMVAVASGVLSGVNGILFVEDFFLEKANEWGNEKINNFVVKIAQKKGYEGNDLLGAVRLLEEKFEFAADKAADDFSGGLHHHLRDLSHQPTPVGLLFSFLTQFTGKVYGTDEAGVFKAVTLNEGDLILAGENSTEKATLGVINWFFHIARDMRGYSTSILKEIGTALPGPIVLLLKEISALPIFRNMDAKCYKQFLVWISKLFNETLLGKEGVNLKLIPMKLASSIDFGAVHQFGKQVVPVMINECLVRGFYFIRRFFMEISRNNIEKVEDLQNINWKDTLPFENKTIIRMLTISTGTMTAINLAVAAIESAVKSGGAGPAFLSNMLVKVNFLGVGRFAIAVGSDINTGVKRGKLRNQCIVAMNKHLFLLNGKTFYKQAEMWIAAEEAGETIEEAYELMEKTAKEYVITYSDIKNNLKKIGDHSVGIKQKNAELLEDIIDILKWGNVNEQQ